jgi:hypothetical protein
VNDELYALNADARRLLEYLYSIAIKVGGRTFQISPRDPHTKESTGLDGEPYMRAASWLVRKKLAKWFASGGSLTIEEYGIQVAGDEGLLDHELPVARGVEPQRGTEEGSMAPTTTTRIFISHSSADVEIAKAVLSLIKAGLEVPTGAILCSSVDGHKLEGGDDAPEVLRAHLKGCNVVLCVLTKRSLSSSYVLMELGAAWAFKKRAIPLLGPGATLGDLPGPFKDIIALSMEHTPDMAGVIETIAKETGFVRTHNLAEITAMAQALKDKVTVSGTPGVAPPPFAPNPTPAPAPAAAPPADMHDDEANVLLEVWLKDVAEAVHSLKTRSPQIIAPADIAARAGVPEPKVQSLLAVAAIEHDYIGVTVKRLANGKFHLDIGPARVRRTRDRFGRDGWER